MIRHSLHAALVIAAAALACSSSVAVAAPGAWDVPSGDQGTYTYSNGQTLTGNFGSGTAFNGGFFFSPPSLEAEAFGNSSRGARGTPVAGHDEASDTLSVILSAKPNNAFSRISSSILGDFSIFGTGLVNATGALRVTNLDTATTLTSPLAFGGTVPAADINGSNDGPFAGAAAIALPAGWTNIRVEMDGFVSADATGGTSLIQAKDAEVGVETMATTEIPIPAAFAVAPIAAAIGWRARRKLGIVR